MNHVEPLALNWCYGKMAVTAVASVANHPSLELRETKEQKLEP